jgi:anti-sigma regulatory factor (Ser/Thr protein kinase)
VPNMAAADGLRHMSFFYQSLADYRAALSPFVRAGLAHREPVLLAVPQPSVALPDWPAGSSALLTVTDMAELGRNPARIIPALRSFAERHLGHRARIITESVWPGRSPAEAQEAARNDALVDLALADMRATVVCPFAATGLPAAALSDATRAHQWQLQQEAVRPNSQYSALDNAPAAISVPLAPVPPEADTVQYTTDLRPVRAMVTAACHRAGLSVMQTTDMTLAVSEIAANTLRHTKAGGVTQAWLCDGELLCQISDTGHITDPLAGILKPAADQPGGLGLWLVNQLCDLVELRTGDTGTVIRLHIRIQRGQADRAFAAPDV